MNQTLITMWSGFFYAIPLALENISMLTKSKQENCQSETLPYIYILKLPFKF